MMLQLQLKTLPSCPGFRLSSHWTKYDLTLVNKLEHEERTFRRYIVTIQAYKPVPEEAIQELIMSFDSLIETLSLEVLEYEE